MSASEVSPRPCWSARRPCRVERVREGLDQPQPLGDRQGGVVALVRELVVPREELPASRRCEQEREVLVRLVVLDRVVCPLDALEGVGEAAGVELDLREVGGRARRGVQVALTFEESDRPLELLVRGVGVAGCHRVVAGPRAQPRLLDRVLDQPCGSRQPRQRLGRRPERSCAIARAGQPVDDLRAKRVGIGRVGLELEGGEVVGRDDLDHFLFSPAPARLEEAGRGQVPHLAVAARERLVRDVADEVLQEAVLAALRRTRIQLEEHDLLADEAVE